MNAPVSHIMIDAQGVPRTLQRRVKVKMIVQRYLFAEEALDLIAADYGLSLADVHAALAYYYDNQTAMDVAFAEDETLIKQYGVDGATLKARALKRLGR